MKTPPGDPNSLVKRQIRRGFSHSWILKWAKAEHRRLLADPQVTKPLPIAGSIRELFTYAPDLEYPQHLEPYIDALQRAMTDNVRICLSAPPRHSKTVTTLMALAYHLLNSPGKKHCYVTYNGGRRDRVRDHEFMPLLRELGIPATKVGDTVSWNGGSVTFTTVQGSLTGYTFDGLIVVDDPVKDKMESNSPTIRQNVWGFFVTGVMTRQFEHLSIIAMMTRWDTDDLIGRLAKQGWRYINLPSVAIDEEDPLGRQPGDPLWDRKELVDHVNEQRRLNEVEWECMYQGNPIPQGTRVFNEPVMFDILPRHGKMFVHYGLDLGYTGKGDWCCLWELHTDLQTMVTYIKDVWHRQCPWGSFIPDILLAQKANAGPIYWKTGFLEGTAIADELRKQGVKRLTCINSRLNKYAWCFHVGEAWNSGNVRFPVRGRDELDGALEEIIRFSGDPRAKDDAPDALASGFYPIAKKLIGRPLVVHIPNRGVEKPEKNPFTDVGAYRDRLKGEMPSARPSRSGRW